MVNLITTISRSIKKLFEAQQRIIRRVNLISDMSSYIDVGKADYEFYRKLERGRAIGYELSGLFSKPVSSKIASWVVGEMPIVYHDNERLSQRLNEWLQHEQSAIVGAYQESLKIGDSYLLVNPDLSVIGLAPEAVSELVDESDYSRVIGHRIEMTYPYPSNTAKKMKIVHEWRADTHTVYKYFDGALTSTEVFSNPLGRSPVIQIANRKSPLERNGRPEIESLLPLLKEYNRTLTHALAGNRRQGQPTPVLSAMDNQAAINAFWEQHKVSRTIYLPDGSMGSEEVVNFDPSKMMTLSGNARFTWESPAPFGGDTQIFLQLLFYLLIEHAELPEYVFGNAVQSSKASTETQTPVFEQFVIKRRQEVTHWLKELLIIASLYLALIDRRLQTNFEQSMLNIRFQPLSAEDTALVMKAVEFAYNNVLIDRETALKHLPLQIDNYAAILQRAEQERTEMEFEAIAQAQVEQELNQDEADQAIDGESVENYVYRHLLTSQVA